MFDTAVLDPAPTSLDLPLADGASTGVRGACTSAGAVDVAGLSDDELLAMVPELEQVRRSAEALQCAVLGELDVRGTTDQRFGHRTATWYARTVNCSLADARARVRTGRRLRRLDLVGAAFTDGSLSFDHARVVADLATPRNAGIVAGVEDQVVALADVLPFERWRAEVKGLVDLLDDDGGFRPGPENSTLRMTTGFGGSLEMAGTFTALDGAALRTAVEARADRLAIQFRREVQAGTLDVVPTRGELLAQALTELVREGLVAGRTGTGPVTDLTLVAHAHDPLGTRDGHSHPHGRGCVPPGGHGPALGDTSSGSATPPPAVRPARGDHDGQPDGLSDATARTLCCDPVIRTVVLDSLGNPVDLGRSTRIVPKGLRRALEVRDGGCVFPGCDAPSSWCDLHHVVHWADGGPTSAQNLASLCRHHHGVTHRRGWTMTADPVHEQRFTWTRPDGTVLRSQRRSDLSPPPAHSPPRE